MEFVKYINRVMALMCAVISIVACDSREDLYLDEVNQQRIVVYLNDRVDTTWGYKNDPTPPYVFTYDLYVTHVNFANLDFDTLVARASQLVNGREYPLRVWHAFPVDEYGNVDKSMRRPDPEDTLTYRLSIVTYDYFDSDTASKCIKHDVRAFAYYDVYNRYKPSGLNDVFDELGDGYLCFFVDIMLWGPCPPMPVLDILDSANDPMEKTLSLARSYDKDGCVKKYEYCIDGNVVPYKATDNRFEHVTGVWQSGKAAYGGVYFTATELSEVKFVFQTEGLHTIYYRCMDDMSVWSTWRSETINVVR